ncbi:MAG: diaminopimelate epimerase [Desulfobulbaceae bacterium]|nr:diaminopimelate epimerase [Desulfobulbaceae bacterium]
MVENDLQTIREHGPASIACAHWPLPFWKMSGAGNDFIIIDHRRPLIASEQMAEFARLTCRRKFGVGADGLFFIENSEQADFQWRFFNADGSEAEMCGNGARCVARFAYMNGIAAAHMRFATLAGIIEASVEGPQVTIHLTPPGRLELNHQVLVGGHEYTVHLINTGVPHGVVFVNDLAHTDVRGVGFSLRHHVDFGPAGVNVNFAALHGDGLRIRTYERGVEDETFACGTGAVATALIASHLGKVQSPVTVTTSGGVQLAVLFTPQGMGEFSSVQLKGPAHIIYSGELSPEALAS